MQKDSDDQDNDKTSVQGPNVDEGESSEIELKSDDEDKEARYLKMRELSDKLMWQEMYSDEEDEEDEEP